MRQFFIQLFFIYPFRYPNQSVTWWSNPVSLPITFGNINYIANAIPKYEPFNCGTNKNYTVRGHHYTVIKNNLSFTQQGIASWYGAKFHGRKTANGEIDKIHAITAAHKILSLHFCVKVMHLDNGKTTIVHINDRESFHAKRIIDFSYVSEKIGMTGTTLFV